MGTHEVEAKFLPDGPVDLAGLGLPGVRVRRGPVHELDATYFDTPTLRLARSRCALRRRLGGSDAGWHLKLPDGDAGRLELQVGLDDAPTPPDPAAPRPAPRPARAHVNAGRPRTELPERLRRVVPVLLAGEDVRPVLRLRTRRQVWVLSDEAGRQLAEGAEDEVRADALDAAGRIATTSRWRELEIELVGGEEGLLRAAATRLQEAGVLPAGYASKFARGLGERLEKTLADGVVGPGDTAARALTCYLDEQVLRLRVGDALVRGAGTDGVHQIRVAARRLRSALQAYRRLFRGDAPAQLIGELRRLGQDLGEARDAEVLAERTGPGRAPDGAGRPHPETVAVLDSRRYAELLARLEDFVAAPRLRKRARKDATVVLAPLLDRAWRRVRHRMDTAHDLPPARGAKHGRERAAALHEVRKAVKRLRYAAELAAPALGERVSAVVEAAADVQQVLGDHHDAWAAAEHLAGRDVPRDRVDEQWAAVTAAERGYREAAKALRAAAQRL